MESLRDPGRDEQSAADEHDEEAECRGAVNRALAIMKSACLRFSAAERETSGGAESTLGILAAGSDLEAQASACESESADVGGICVASNRYPTA